MGEKKGRPETTLFVVFLGRRYTKMVYFCSPVGLYKKGGRKKGAKTLDPKISLC